MFLGGFFVIFFFFSCGRGSKAVVGEGFSYSVYVGYCSKIMFCIYYINVFLNIER